MRGDVFAKTLPRSNREVPPLSLQAVMRSQHFFRLWWGPSLAHSLASRWQRQPQPFSEKRARLRAAIRLSDDGRRDSMTCLSANPRMTHPMLQALRVSHSCIAGSAAFPHFARSTAHNFIPFLDPLDTFPSRRAAWGCPLQLAWTSTRGYNSHWYFDRLERSNTWGNKHENFETSAGFCCCSCFCTYAN